MAESKITLTLGGRYTAGAAFTSLDTDVKGIQKSTKDMTDAARKSVGTLAGLFDGQLNGTIKTTYNLLGDIARGGLWGALGAIANATIQTIIDKINAAREAAFKFAEICRSEVVNAMTAASDKFKGVSTEIANAKADANEMLNVLNGSTAASAEAKIHQLHIASLQKITDDMSTAGKNAILANEAYEAALIRNAASLEQAEAIAKNASDKAQLAQQKRAAAEETLNAITTQYADLESQMLDYGRGWLAQRQAIQDNIAKNEQMYADGMIDQATFIQHNKNLKLELEKVETEHKEELTQLTTAQKAVADATKNVEAAVREETTATNALTLAQQKQTVAKEAAAAAEAEAAAKMRTANDLLEKENAEKQMKIQQAELERHSAEERLAIMEATNKIEQVAQAKTVDKTYFLEMFTNLLSEGLTKEEAYQNMQSRLTEITDGRAQIEKVCGELGIEQAEIIDAFNESMYNGATKTEAFNVAQEKLTDAIDKRTKAEEEAASDSSSSSSSTKNKRPMVVSLNASSISNISSSIDKNTKKGRSIMSDIRQEQKELKRRYNQMMRDWKTDTPFFNGWLKGDMPKEMADKYLEKLVQKYPADFIEKQTGAALKEKMLTTTEQKQHNKRMEELVTIAKNMGLK